MDLKQRTLAEEMPAIRVRHEATSSGAPYDSQATMYTDIVYLLEEIERWRALLDGRDQFIVNQGLWQKFCDSLPK